jgi:2-oxoglutarate ferredoxin oxidoreductase subunit beta
LTEKETREINQIRLVEGEPIRFGPDGGRGVAMRADGALEIVEVAARGVDALLVHDPTRDDPGLAFALAKLSSDPNGPTPIGVLRSVKRKVYRRSAVAASAAGEEQLAALLHSSDIWTVGS